MTDDELRGLLAKATPGPWDLDYDNDVGHDDSYFFEWVKVGPAILADRDDVNDPDARLIALAPTLAAQRLADAEKIARLTEALREISSGPAWSHIPDPTCGDLDLLLELDQSSSRFRDQVETIRRDNSHLRMGYFEAHAILKDWSELARAALASIDEAAS